MPNVRAKFRVDCISDYGDSGEVILSAVTSGSEENKSFWKFTPSGTIKMHIDNPIALKQFKPQQEVYVDFTVIEPPVEHQSV